MVSGSVSRKGPDYLNNKRRFLKFEKYTNANFITTDPNSLDFKSKNCLYTKSSR